MCLPGDSAALSRFGSLERDLRLAEDAALGEYTIQGGDDGDRIYPYYCVEQTMSAALPAIYVDRMRKRMRLPAGEGPAPETITKKAVDRLVRLQHADGSSAPVRRASRAN